MEDSLSSQSVNMNSLSEADMKQKSHRFTEGLYIYMF